jgi:DNA polymerase
MERELAALYDEILRRQQQGERDLYLRPDNLEFLRRESKRRLEGEPVPRVPGKPPARKRSRGSQDGNADAAPRPPSAPEVVLSGADSRQQWEALKETVLSDPWCRSQLKPNKKIVFGTGDLDARIFFCGEAPGAEEEMAGEPFVGPAGQLLTRIIKAMGLTRESVYIGNIMNYRPPVPGPVGNRAPTLEEMAYCLPYLRAQIEIVQPEVIVALGKTALDGLLGKDPRRRMTAVRGHWHTFREIPLMPTFHPSYLLRNQSPGIKRQVWEDMLAVMDRLEMPVADKQRQYFR